MTTQFRLFAGLALVVSLVPLKGWSQDRAQECPSIPLHSSFMHGDGETTSPGYAPVPGLQNPGLEVVRDSRVNLELAKFLETNPAFKVWTSNKNASVSDFEWLVVRYMATGPTKTFSSNAGVSLLQTPIRFHIRVAKKLGLRLSPERGTLWIDGVVNVLQREDGKKRLFVNAQACEFGAAHLGDMITLGSIYDGEFIRGITAGVLMPALQNPGAFDNFFAITESTVP